MVGEAGEVVRVLVACEFSGTVRDAFRRHGHQAYSCDLLPSDNPMYHIQGDVLEVLGWGWDLMIAHPPCTYITNAGVRHLHSDVTSRNGKRTGVYGVERWAALGEACEFFNALQSAPIPQIAIENPIPHKYAKDRIGPYTQLIQPWMFGHKETKATCLWLKGLPPIIPTEIVGPPPRNLTPEEKRSWHKVHMTSPGPNRWKLRSKTYLGIADAFASQWGGAEEIASPTPIAA